MSPTYLDWARRNLDLNGFSGPEHTFIRADCLAWLASNAARGGAYDLVFLDAPTFSNSKSMEETLDIQRDHFRLVRSAARLMARDGVLLFSTNYRRFKLDPTLEEEFRIEDITKRTLPPDFSRNPRIHRCFRITRPQNSGD
jgi:23S rRNA (guanine2445-N2)-methyltransferase / 23S rRNA (guanine2069-N7)-methyltransferase